MNNLPAKLFVLGSVLFATAVGASCLFVDQSESNYVVHTANSNWFEPPTSKVVCDENIACCLLTVSDLTAGSAGESDSESSGSGGNSGSSGRGGIGGVAGAAGLPGFYPLLF